MIDIGVNLTSGRFEAERDAVIERAWSAGLTAMITIGTDLDDSHRAQGLAAGRPGIYSTAGLHPHRASSWDQATPARLVELLARPGVVAAGEMGLDFNRDYSPHPQQRDVFRRQLELACASRHPLLLHQRDAVEDFLAILDEFAGDLPGGVAHCFTDDRETAEAYLARGLHIGVTGWIADNRRNRALREAVPHLPAERLVIETDAPYLVPRDLPDPPANRRNEPAFLPHIAEVLSHHRGDPVTDLVEQTTRNAQRLFRLDATDTPT
jgi:TatD DNase family protein